MGHTVLRSNFCLTHPWALRNPVFLAGITDLFFYAGRGAAPFALHTEDVNLASCNLSLQGSGNKHWYSVPSSDLAKLERLTGQIYSEGCRNHLQHKVYFLDPDFLASEGITVCHTIQRPNQLVITLPAAAHQGVSDGYNLGCAWNVGCLGWAAYGLDAKVCIHKYKVYPNRTIELCRKYLQVINGQNLVSFSPLAYAASILRLSQLSPNSIP